jgi:murein DD-endopeptidase MepM/ murein hydrolase activator NlpD
VKVFAGLLIVLLALPAMATALELQGRFTQGGLIRGKTEPGAQVSLDGRKLRVSPAGDFVFGFGRDAPAKAVLRIRLSDGAVREKILTIAPREYPTQRIDGLPAHFVTPPAAVLARIKRENAAIAKVRTHDLNQTYYLGDWLRPAAGHISGVFGSQRILNGQKKRPHFGLDFAGPAGSPVIAPADGIVVLAESDLYYTGVTVFLDHGYGLISAYLHMSKRSVKPGDFVKRGQQIGAIGATGRVTGPHLDWRVNWFDQRLDPAYLIPPEK